MLLFEGVVCKRHENVCEWSGRGGGRGGAAGVLATQKSKISRGLSILTLHMVLLAQYVAQFMPQIGTKTVPFQ